MSCRSSMEPEKKLFVELFTAQPFIVTSYSVSIWMPFYLLKSREPFCWLLVFFY
jgi:hypothetical protein